MQHETTNLKAGEEKFLNHLKGLDQLDIYDRDKLLQLADLPIAEIQNICAEVWQASTSDFVGRINHNNSVDKQRKFSFLAACYYYSNQSITDIAKFVGCQFNTAADGRNRICNVVKYQWKEANKYFQIFLLCSQKCPGRLDKLFAELSAKEEAEKKEQQIRHSSLNEQIHNNLVKALELNNKILEMENQGLKDKIKKLEGKGKERVMPSDAVCFDCPYNKRCQLKGLGIPLCPWLTKLNNDYDDGRYCYVRYVDQCLQKEKIKLN